MLARIARNLAKVARLVSSGQAAELRYQLENRLKGVDLDFVSIADLGLSPARAHFHSSSGGAVLAKVFTSLGIAPGSVLIDLGSGKGGAALTLSRVGFAEVVGVELSAALVTIAKENATRLGRRNVRFVHGDAAAFQDYDRATHVYMYNPFPCAVMSEVVSHLAASLSRAPRRLTIVYRHPVCHDTLMQSGLFEADDERRPDQHAWRVYRSR